MFYPDLIIDLYRKLSSKTLKKKIVFGEQNLIFFFLRKKFKFNFTVPVFFKFKFLSLGTSKSELHKGCVRIPNLLDPQKVRDKFLILYMLALIFFLSPKVADWHNFFRIRMDPASTLFLKLKKLSKKAAETFLL